MHIPRLERLTGDYTRRKKVSNPDEPKFENLGDLKEGLSHKPPQIPATAPAIPSLNQLMSFGEKVTYTFLHNKEAGSIHFDRSRREIYYKGHNLKNMDLRPEHLKMLEQMRRLLRSDPNGKNFADEYDRTLDKILPAKKNSASP